MSANDDHLLGIRMELQLIERWMHLDRPVWGICLGAQLMARVLGSRVFTHHRDQVEIGWYPIKPLGQGKQIFGPLSRVYQWHREGYYLPQGAIRLASGVVDGHFEEQAFRVGHHGLGDTVPSGDASSYDEPMARAGRPYVGVAGCDEYP